LSIARSYKSQKTESYGNLICDRPQEKGEETLLGLLERGNLVVENLLLLRRGTFKVTNTLEIFDQIIYYHMKMVQFCCKFGLLTDYVDIFDSLET
jgi:hypothetical protein